MSIRSPRSGIVQVALGVFCAGACMHPRAVPPAPVRATAYSMRLLIDAIEGYERRRGAVPRDLETLCSEVVWCETSGQVGHTLRDGWGTPFRYIPLSGSEYELRSAGADQMERTPDDIVYNPRAEAERVTCLKALCNGFPRRVSSS
jgi:hypothetical protein